MDGGDLSTAGMFGLAAIVRAFTALLVELRKWREVRPRGRGT
jgi:hypothetical protein